MRLFLCSLFLLLSSPTFANDIITGRAFVIDGDTIIIHNTRIRIWGIDAPESKQLCIDNKGQNYRCGQKASFALADWLDKSQPIQCNIQYKDRYKRFVAKCVRADNRDLGDYMVSNGHALDWPRYSQGYYSNAQEKAKQKKSGIWAGSFLEPWQWRWNKKSNKIN
ncbi:thermonuclease family protein [Bartonella sp. HY406]|uniref:thermonuclease family protein n=1 Tax=Bartonella sp. HY406 TaxID=2979331 RepID=UPI0021C644DD|nr:thermonuclease family protein [Bartonella sp. HY406]UXN04080.1 thermonuclease family protein [Bartonella sp. HY406]